MGDESIPVATSGRQITDRVLYQGMRINIIAGALGMSWIAMTQGMPLTMLMEALGSSGVKIGLVTTMLQISLVMQIAGAFFCARFLTRKPIWAAAALLSRVMWFLPALCLILYPQRMDLVATVVVAVAGGSALLGQSVSALWHSWMADLIPDRMRGRFWGERQGWTMLAFLVAMGIAGYVLDVLPSPHHAAEGGTWNGFILLFVVGATLGALDIVIHMWVPEPRQTLAKVGNWLDQIVSPLRDADFRRFTIGMGIYTFSIGLVSLGVVYLKKDFNVTYSHLSALAIVSSLGTLASSFIWGYALDRIGGRAFVASMVFVAPFFAASWFFMQDFSTDFVGLFRGISFVGPAISILVSMLPEKVDLWIRSSQLPQPIWIHVFVGFLAGAFYGGIGLSQLNLSGALSPKNNRTMAMGVHWALVGLIGSAGPLLAGKVMDHFAANPVDYVFPGGAKFSFHHVLIILHAGIMWFLVLPILLKIRRRKGEPQFVIAVSQLFVNNPLRTFTNIYMMDAAVTSRQRARAVHNLGKRRTAIAVVDLIQKLDDPASDVREEAALALGSIGSNDAVAALVAKLNDPASDLAPHVARALRIAKNRASVDALLRHLDDPDKETQRECIRALGEIGDQRSVHPLIDVLSSSDDVKVLTSVAEALARLREVSAVYQLVPRMKDASTPYFKLALEASVGETFGEPDEYYKLLTNERKSPGERIPRLLMRVRREIRRFRGGTADERNRLCESTRRIQSLIETRSYPECFEELFQLAVALARLRWNLPHRDNPDEQINDIILTDIAFGAGVWYLHNLRQPWLVSGNDTRSHLEVLLGVYFLATRRLQD